MTNLIELGKNARAAASKLALAPTGDKNKALLAIADAIAANMPPVLEANAVDIAAAVQNGMRTAMQDRLLLTEDRLLDIADAVRYVAGLDDPIGKVTGGDTRPNGLNIVKRTVPLGVIGIICESRPNVTVDCAVLCLKSGNACILRGGKEAINSNIALTKIMRGALRDIGFDESCIQLVDDTSRETATEMMRLNGYIDVLIPRGGKGLIASVVKNSTVPVIETGSGNCHVFVDASAELDMAANIVDNAKTSRPGVCNAAETLLVHRDIAEAILPLAAQRLAKSNVELRCCPESLKILQGSYPAKITTASEDDWATEYEDYILAIKVVGSIDEAIAHIEKYSTHHSDAIITSSYENSMKFTTGVDSAAVYVNASTRFTDGGVFGFGAEIGISSQKLHARGPMGLTHLTSHKYVINGNGQIR